MEATCLICKQTKDISQFSINYKGQVRSYCKPCDCIRGKKVRTQDKIRESILTRLRSRCKQRGTTFDLDVNDIVIPSHCPILGIPLAFNTSIKDDSVSIDRIDPNKGYVKGNIQIISMRANRIKTDASIQELELVLKHMKENNH